MNGLLWHEDARIECLVLMFARRYRFQNERWSNTTKMSSCLTWWTQTRFLSAGRNVLTSAELYARLYTVRNGNALGKYLSWLMVFVLGLFVATTSLLRALRYGVVPFQPSREGLFWIVSHGWCVSTCFFYAFAIDMLTYCICEHIRR